MLVLAAVLFAITSNLDNLTAGLALGLRRVRVSLASNAVIAAVTMVGTAGAMMLGATLTRSVAATAASLLGGLALVAVGVWMTVTGIRSAGPSGGLSGSSGTPGRVAAWLDSRAASAGAGGERLGAGRAVVLAVALAANNVVQGVPAGAAGLPLLLVSGLAGLISMLFVGGGVRLASALALRLAGRFAPAVSGLLILAVGALTIAGAG